MDYTRIVHTIKENVPNGVLLAVCDIIHSHLVVIIGLLVVYADLRKCRVGRRDLVYSFSMLKARTKWDIA